MLRHITMHSLVAAGASLALFAPSAGPAVAEPGEIAEIEQRLQQYEARFNQRDAGAVAALFDEDAVYYDATGQVHEGRQSVEDYYQGILEAGFSGMEIDMIEVEVFGDTAFDIARYTVSGPGGEPLTGYHLAILEKEDGEWHVQRTMVNAVMPGPPGE